MAFETRVGFACVLLISCVFAVRWEFCIVCGMSISVLGGPPGSFIAILAPTIAG